MTVFGAIECFPGRLSQPVEGDPALRLDGAGIGDDDDDRKPHLPLPARTLEQGTADGQKRPLKPKDVWTIRVHLQLEGRRRDLAMFNLAIDSKLRGCGLVRLTIDDVVGGGIVRDRATVIQKKTGRPVQFQITEQTRSAIGEWLAKLDVGRADIYSRAGSGNSRISPRGSMPVSSIDGWRARVSTVRRTARTRCVARSRLRSTRRPATCGPCSYCWGTRSWRAPFDISGSRLMTRSPSRSRSNYRRCEPCGPGNQGRGACHTGWLSLPYPTLPVGWKIGSVGVDSGPSSRPPPTARLRRFRPFP
jgi:hypothetical protein